MINYVKKGWWEGTQNAVRGEGGRGWVGGKGTIMIICFAHGRIDDGAHGCITEANTMIFVFPHGRIIEATTMILFPLTAASLKQPQRRRREDREARGGATVRTRGGGATRTVRP